MFVSSVFAALVALPFVAQCTFQFLSVSQSSHILTTVCSTAALASSCTRTYTVQQGDWCDTISAAHNSSTFVFLRTLSSSVQYHLILVYICSYQLAVVNIDKIDSACSNLIPGDQLCLGTEGQDCTETYVVLADDTCESVANNHRINATVFNQNNPQLNADCDNLYTGEVMSWPWLTRQVSSSDFSFRFSA